MGCGVARQKLPARTRRREFKHASVGPASTSTSNQFIVIAASTSSRIKDMGSQHNMRWGTNKTNAIDIPILSLPGHFKASEIEIIHSSAGFLPWRVNLVF